MSINKKSPYTAAITGGGFLFEETNILLPLLQSEERDKLLKQESLYNELLQINSEKSRKRCIAEVKRRYNAVSPSFWVDYQAMAEENQYAALFFVLLKTYKILFDFHTNVTIKRWNSISKAIFTEDLMMEFNEISANDAFVDSWSEMTKRKVASAYLTILRKIGMLDTDNQLQSLSCSNFDYYIRLEEQWFLEAALLLPYQIETIKKSTL
ncbi:BrxA family protein [Bacteroides propionicifaciens]|uniref:BrxA family protein n=2 Tax=Bacteroides propionicifaciens TaxID=392838 RepID=UPI0003796C6C|nr:BrxA family protein [Bacteroides propionicifaciens]